MLTMIDQVAVQGLYNYADLPLNILGISAFLKMSMHVELYDPDMPIDNEQLSLLKKMLNPLQY